MQGVSSLTACWVPELLQTAQGRKEAGQAESSFCMTARKSKGTKHMGWGPKTRLFLLAFGIIALLREQPFSKEIAGHTAQPQKA